MSTIARALEAENIPYLFYADDIVIFHSHKDLKVATNFLNNSLELTNNYLINLHLFVAPVQCKVVIFTRKHRLDIRLFRIGGATIPVVNQVTYLGLILNLNLRWRSHLNFITSFGTKWSNMLKCISGIWWGSHPVSILTIYKSIIRSKLEFGCPFFRSTASSHSN